MLENLDLLENIYKTIKDNCMILLLKFWYLSWKC